MRANAYCAVDGIGERLPLNIIEGKERERILVEQKNRARVLFEVIFKRGNRGVASVKDVRLVDAPILVASCGRPLPPWERTPWWRGCGSHFRGHNVGYPCFAQECRPDQ